MHARVQNDVLISTLAKHMKGKNKVSVNFTICGNYLTLQSSADYILDTIVEGEFSTDMNNKSFSAMITNSILLLDQDDGMTEISDNNGVVVLNQGSKILPFLSTHDERIDIKWNGLSKVGIVSSRDINEIASDFRSLMNTSKVLNVGVPPVIINSGKSYCFYYDTILIKKVPIVFPNMEIPYSTFSNLSKNLTNKDITVNIDERSKSLVLQDGDYGISSAGYKKTNEDSINGVEERMKDLNSVGLCDLDTIKSLSGLYKCFPKESVTLCMFDDLTFGVSITVVGLNTFNAGMKNKRRLANIIINTAQFNAIYATFKNESRVNVSIGKDLICLNTTSTTLLLSGMSY